MRLAVRTVVLVAACGATLALAGPAEAVSWGPLASYYKGQQRSFSTGTFIDDRATYATVRVYLNDSSNDGNNVYTNADEYFLEQDPLTCGDAGACWVFDREKRSAEYGYRNTPVSFSLYNSLHDQGSAARASIYTCAQMGWPVPDQCSPRAVVSFSY